MESTRRAVLMDKFKHETHLNETDEELSKHLEDMTERGWELISTSSSMSITPKTEWDAGGNMILSATFIWKRPAGQWSAKRQH